MGKIATFQSNKSSWIILGEERRATQLLWSTGLGRRLASVVVRKTRYGRGRYFGAVHLGQHQPPARGAQGSRKTRSSWLRIRGLRQGTRCLSFAPHISRSYPAPRCRGIELPSAHASAAGSSCGDVGRMRERRRASRESLCGTSRQASPSQIPEARPVRSPRIDRAVCCVHPGTRSGLSTDFATLADGLIDEIQQPCGARFRHDIDHAGFDVRIAVHPDAPGIRRGLIHTEGSRWR